MSAKYFDSESVLSRLDNDVELLDSLIRCFEENAGEYFRQISDAIERKDAPEVKSSAHHIKGALGNIGSSRAFEIAQSLENAGRDNQIEKAVEIFQDLQNAFERFLCDYERFQSELSSHISEKRGEV